MDDDEGQRVFDLHPFWEACKVDDLDAAKRALPLEHVNSRCSGGGALRQGMQPLGIACHYEALPIVKWLLENGADPHIIYPHDGGDGNRLMHQACLRGNRELAWLLHTIGGVSYDCYNHLGLTPLNLVVGWSHSAIASMRMVEWLIDHGVAWTTSYDSAWYVNMKRGYERCRDACTIMFALMLRKRHGRDVATCVTRSMWKTHWKTEWIPCE